jgi:hypothetical protein
VSEVSGQCKVAVVSERAQCKTGVRPFPANKRDKEKSRTEVTPKRRASFTVRCSRRKPLAMQLAGAKAFAANADECRRSVRISHGAREMRVSGLCVRPLLLSTVKEGGDCGSAAPRKNNGRGRPFYIPAPYLVAGDRFRPLATDTDTSH